MDYFVSRKQRNFKFITRLLLIIIFALQIWLKPIYPNIINWITYGLIGLGFVLFIGANVISRRYSNDFQPATLFGRPTSNLNARKFLYDTGVSGCSIVAIGFIIWLIGSMVSE